MAESGCFRPGRGQDGIGSAAKCVTYPNSVGSRSAQAFGDETGRRPRCIGVQEICFVSEILAADLNIEPGVHHIIDRNMSVQQIVGIEPGQTDDINVDRKSNSLNFSNQCETRMQIY